MVTLAFGSAKGSCQLETDLDSCLLTSGVGSEALDLLDKVGALGDLTEDDVLAVQPRGDDGGDEELGSVGVGSSIGHGEEEWSVVSELEVLVRELVAVDGLKQVLAIVHQNLAIAAHLSTGTVVVGELHKRSERISVWTRDTHVTTLEHEVGDDSVESRAGVTEALVTSAEGSEVGGSLGDDVVVQFERDSASWGVWEDISC